MYLLAKNELFKPRISKAVVDGGAYTYLQTDACKNNLYTTLLRVW